MTTINVIASGNITVALQAAIDAAVDGDVVNITAGTCTCGAVDLINKNITVRGQGIGVTTVSGLRIGFTLADKAAFRITGISCGAPLEGADPSQAMWQIIRNVYTTAPTERWRFDHLEFIHTEHVQRIFLYIQGISWGLVDHCTFVNCGNTFHIDSWVESSDETDPFPIEADPGLGGASWALPFTPGTDKAVYVEDCTIIENDPNPTPGTFYGVCDCNNGARMVFRHNNCLNNFWQTHACRVSSRGGACTLEVYDNVFDADHVFWSGFGRAIFVRAGTGVIYNNVFRGFMNIYQCDNQRSNGQAVGDPYGTPDGTKPWDGNVGTPGVPGWPCLDQIGRAPGTPFATPQPSEPLYAWNNTLFSGGTVVNLISDGDPAVLAGRDFINGVRPGYTPFAYPHPLIVQTESVGQVPLMLTMRLGLHA